MAALFNLDDERDARVDAAFGEIVGYLRELRPRDAIARVGGFESQLAGVRLEAIAKLNLDTGSDRAAKRAMNDGKRSKRAVARAAKRGDVANKNAGLIGKVASGELSEEQLDVIADASDKTDGEAAADPDFIDEIASVNPDQGESVKNRYLAKRATAEGTQSEHDRQRALRRALKYVSKKSGLDVIAIEGDGIAAKNMWDRIQERARQIYEADGGLDVANGSHPRTHQQRLNDAAYELICGVTTTPTGVSHTPRYGDAAGGPSRPQIFVGITFDQYVGRDPAAVATQVGVGVIPASVLLDYLEHADIIGVLYDKNGQPLWLGRAKRHASLMQRYALIMRDQCCVLCGADHAQCEVHHVIPWSSPDQGKTDLDQLVLLCGPCHRQLHADVRTVFQDRQGHWRTRPATAGETPAPRPTQHNRPQRE